MSRTLLFVLCSAPMLAAQTVLNGFVYDGHGGPLLAGHVYHSPGIVVPAGTTLTIEAGAIVKLQSMPLAPASFSVQGTLLVGTGPSPVGVRAIVTSIDDDSAGGDTNGNGGATSPAPGDWFRMTLASSAGASVLRHLELRYGGNGQYPTLQLNQADVVLEDCFVHHGDGAALDLGNTSRPTVTNCAFDGCRTAISGVQTPAVPGFHGNTATGNLLGDTMVTSGSITGGQHLVIGPDNLFQDHVLGWISANGLGIDATSSLVLQPGTILKTRLAGVGIDVQGDLHAVGTPAAPIVFTSWRDDGNGGDTDKNGPSSGAPGDWRTIDFQNGSSASVLQHARVAFGGYGNGCSIQVFSSPSLLDCTIDHGAGPALNLRYVGTPVLERCTFADNLGIAIEVAPWAALPRWLDNVAVGNAAGDYCRVDGAVAGAVEVWPWNYPGTALVAPHITVPAGASLRLHQNVILKLDQFAHSIVTGALDVDGAGDQPVIVTSIDDDRYGGDTRKDGPAGANPLRASYLTMQTGAQLRLHHAVFAYHGGFLLGQPGFDLYGVREEFGGGFQLSAPGVVTQCVAFHNSTHGFVLGGTSNPQLVHCTSVGNQGYGYFRAQSPGTVIDSIGWNNTIADFTGFLTTEASYCNGLGVPPLGAGNTAQDPQFVAEASGDLRLQATSPLLNLGLANPGPPLPLVDIDENSRWLDSAGNLWMLPDMGAHERANWRLVVDGDVRPATTLTARIDGPAGFAFLLLGTDTWGFALPPFGWVSVMPLWPAPWGLLGMMATGPAGAVTLPVPPALPAGISVNFQAIVSSDGFATGNCTNRCRRFTQPR